MSSYEIHVIIVKPQWEQMKMVSEGALDVIIKVKKLRLYALDGAMIAMTEEADGDCRRYMQFVASLPKEYLV